MCRLITLATETAVVLQASSQHPVRFVKMLGAKRRRANASRVSTAVIAIQNLSLMQGLVRQSKQGASVQLTTQNALSFPLPQAVAGKLIAAFHGVSVLVA